jgi:hypothetical protein
VSDTIDLAEFVIEDSYTGPRMQGELDRAVGATQCVRCWWWGGGRIK